MIEISTRMINADEKEQLKKRAPSLSKRIEQFVLLFIGIVLVLDIPLLVYDHFSPVASTGQAIYCIIIVAIALFVTIWIFTRKPGLKKEQRNNASPMQVEVIKVTTNRAVKREDPEDFGVAYYVDVIDKGVHKTLYLCGQYLDELEYKNSFPNTAFEIIRLPNKDEFLEFRLSGQYFKEEKTLPAFDKQVWESGNYPINGELLDVNISEVI